MNPEEIVSCNVDILYEKVNDVIEVAQNRLVTQVNFTMVSTYYEIGRIIVENEQSGKYKAEYGKNVLNNLSKKLSKKFGRGFSKRNLEQMRQFYIIYSREYYINENDNHGKTQTLSAQLVLSWSHYLFLMRINNKQERDFYEKEAINENWSLRELKRQFDSALYERLALSKDKSEIIKLSKQGIIVEKSADIVKDPYVLEFLGLPEVSKYSESDLEERIINKLQMFLLELGKGYTFVGRQVRLTFDEKHFYVDLVFFNRIMQCFVLIDLKIGEITHQDIGQMQMYVNYYDRKVRLSYEKETIGILLCKKKNDMLVEMTLPENNTQIYASEYMTVLPDKEELQKLLADCTE